MSLRIILLYLLVCYIFFYYKWVDGYRKLSMNEELELEEQLNRLNKPAVKTIKTKYDVIYDCVDFYKQPAFDHPLLKNHNFHPETKLISIPRRVHTENEDKNSRYKNINVGLEDGGCPNGTVPIKRTTKDDLIRAKLYREMYESKMNYIPGTYYAMAHTIDLTDYHGVGALLTVWNQPVLAPQYTSGRIKAKFALESIEAGWTVNPGLYGDNRTHLYVFANTKNSHCFNLQCAFIQTNPKIPVDTIIEPVSVFDKQLYGVTLDLRHDSLGGNSTGNWYLLWGTTNQIGIWPSLFFSNLGVRANAVEWGGEVFSPPNVPPPGMGSGHRLSGDDKRDALFAKANVFVNNELVYPPNDLWLFVDNPNYEIRNARDVGGYDQYLITYGGVAGATQA